MILQIIFVILEIISSDFKSHLKKLSASSATFLSEPFNVDANMNYIAVSRNNITCFDALAIL